MERALAEGPSVPLLAAVNKIDTASETDISTLSRWVEEELEGEPFPISALNGRGTGLLLSRLEQLLPPGPHRQPLRQPPRLRR